MSIHNSDISGEETDIIVNTTTEDMKLNDSDVSRALSKKAGPMLQEACDGLVRDGLKLDCGNVAGTKSYGYLQCKKILHAHVPPHAEAVKSSVDHFSMIVDIVTKCLNKAESWKMKSISFPAFGLGQGGYSVAEVAKPMLTALVKFGQNCPKTVEIVRVVILDRSLHKQFFNFFVDFFKIDVSAPGHGERFVDLQEGTVVPQPRTKPVLSFKIFASTDTNCKQIAMKLKESVKEKCISVNVENEVISNLNSEDISEIYRIGRDLQVQVTIQRQAKKIEIFGEARDVKDAQLKIVEIINDIEKAEDQLKFFRWQAGDTPYSFMDSSKLERAKDKKIGALEMIVDGNEVDISIDKMEERNKRTGEARKVTRVQIEPPSEL